MDVFKNWKTWAIILVAILIAGLGAFGMYKLQVIPLREENAELRSELYDNKTQKEALEKALGIVKKEKDEIRGQVVMVKETSIQYVEKEIDPNTGEKEKTNVQMDVDPPSLNLLVNGKSYETKILSGEKHTFQDGKLVLQQTSIATVDIQLPEVERNGFRFGPYLEYDSGSKQKCSAGFKLRREWKKIDADLSIDHDKDVKLGVQFWIS